MPGYHIGVDVGGTKLAYGLFDEHFSLVASAREPSAPELPADDMLELMCNHMDDMLYGAGLTMEDIAGIGLAIPGHIYFSKGVVITASNLPNWAGCHAKEKLRARTESSVVLDNDANVAALAEYKLGAGRGATNMIYVTISTGLGSGIIIDGKLYRGTYGSAGELGHTFLTESDLITCGCGRTRCVETICSGTGMASYAKMRIAGGTKSILPDLSGGIEHISARTISEADKLGDALAAETINRAADGLGTVFYNLYQTFGCDRLVYGGGVSKLGDRLMLRAQERFLNLIPMAREYPMEILPAELGDNTGIVGAALLTV